MCFLICYKGNTFLCNHQIKMGLFCLKMNLFRAKNSCRFQPRKRGRTRRVPGVGRDVSGAFRSAVLRRMAGGRSSSSSCWRKSRQMGSTRLDNCPLLPPFSATRWAIWPHGSFRLRSGYLNSVLLMCAPSIGKSIWTRGSWMSFDTCESRILMHFDAFCAPSELWHLGHGRFFDVVRN